MASVRKRVLASGRAVWLARYVDGSGDRRFRQFATKREAESFLTRVRSEVAEGSHIPDRSAKTVEYAYGLLIAALEADAAARSTVRNYKIYYERQVRPYVGARLLPRLHPADVGEWLDKLRAEGRTDDTRRRARIVLGAIFDEAVRRRLAHTNPVRSFRSRRKTRRAKIHEVEEAVRIPEREEVRALLTMAGTTDKLWLYARADRAEGHSIISRKATLSQPLRALRAYAAEHPGAESKIFRPSPWLKPFLATMVFAGLRIGEVRGLHWHRIKPDVIEIREAVDQFGTLDAVKTVAALRDVPIGPLLFEILAAWGRVSGRTDGLIFPTGNGTPLGYPNIVNRQIGPLQAVGGILAADGSPRWTPHSFRHFAVSLWIDEGASLKQVAEWAGHESPEFTSRVYGHLFHRGRRDRRAVTAGELSVLGEASATEAQQDLKSGRETIYKPDT